MIDIDEIVVEIYSEQQHGTLEPFDNTKLQAINTCPTWGIVRYGKHKNMGGAQRSMALEAGSACHEYFAAVKLHHLGLQMQDLDGLSDEHRATIMNNTAVRLFGHERGDKMTEAAMPHAGDPYNIGRAMATVALDTSGFYDDPKDTRRTLSNLHEACAMYYEQYDFTKRPIYVKNYEDVNTFVGIETPFDVFVSWRQDGVYYRFRFTGRIDGMYLEEDGDVGVLENKTASRLGDAWSLSFRRSSQVTGYMVAAMAYTGEHVWKGRVHGLQIPVPVKSITGGFDDVPVSRNMFDIKQWLTWVKHTIDLYNEYKDRPLEAPQYTHSCNRYFRPCSFIPLCDSGAEERELMLEEMQHDEWSPLIEGL